MRVLVTGGAGYIGSHAVRELINSDHQVTVLDNLADSCEEALDPRANFVKGSTSNGNLLSQILDAQKIEAVIHFATESDEKINTSAPYKYYQNNFSNTLILLNAMISRDVKKFIFSSNAAVYGVPKKNPVEENHPVNPVNYYGRSLMMAEMAIEDFSRANGFSYTILRYFNVAGASLDASIGEDHHPESHLIPRILKAARDEKDVLIYGTDYDTHDGTCIRDYVHVVDLARAYVLALHNQKERQGQVYNIGSGNGFSVREVISICESVVGKKHNVIEAERMDGDPAVLLGSSKKIRQELNWSPIYPEIRTIVQHAWHWHTRRPEGYKGRVEVNMNQASTPQNSNEPDFHRIVVGHG